MLLVLVTSQVGLQAAMSGEAKLLQSLDSFHLLLSHLDLTGARSSRLLLPWSTLRRTTSTWLTHRWHSTAHNHVHESHWVLLNGGVDLRIVLLEASHKLLVELGVLAHALGHVRELWVRHEAHQLGVLSAAWHLHTTTWLLTLTWIFVAVIGKTFITAGWDAIKIDTLKKECASQVSISTGEP